MENNKTKLTIYKRHYLAKQLKGAFSKMNDDIYLSKKYQ